LPRPRKSEITAALAVALGRGGLGSSGVNEVVS